MKKRTAFIGAILSLMPLGQPLLIKTGLFLTSSTILLSVPENANAIDASYYFDLALNKSIIPTTLKHQNWVEPLSGSKFSNF